MESTSGGSGEVHAHLSSQPDKGEGMSAKFERSEAAGGSQEHDGITARARQRAGQAFEGARERGSDFRDRMEGAASRARERADHLFEDAEEAIERSGAVSAARGNPVAALGVAFALGFLLAGESDEPERHPAIAKAKNQVKGAIVGGISAAISQQLRTFIEDQGGIGTLLASLGVPVPGQRGQPYFTPDDELRDA